MCGMLLSISCVIVMVFRFLNFVVLGSFIEGVF